MSSKVQREEFRAVKKIKKRELLRKGRSQKRVSKVLLKVNLRIKTQESKPQRKISKLIKGLEKAKPENRKIPEVRKNPSTARKKAIKANKNNHLKLKIPLLQRICKKTKTQSQRKNKLSIS